MARRDLVEKRLDGLVAGFERYVEGYDQLTPFTTTQAVTHRRTIADRLAAGGVAAALDDREFVARLHRTLTAWRLGMRGSYLAPLDEFFAALQASRAAIIELEPLRIDDAAETGAVADRIWQVMDGLGVVNNKARLVAGTKTLHHLLPDLVVPMDRRFTGKFFGLHPYEWQSDQQRTFRRLHAAFAEVARAVGPERYVTGTGWRTSRTKVLDNAMIAYCRTCLENTTTANQVSFTVAGLPPAKSEALSMLGPGHPHTERVRALLRAAEDAVARQEFTPLTDVPVALELVVRTAAGDRVPDATNLLGGVADVLENKDTRSSLSHLGALASVWLYWNDRQIKQVSYREATAASSSYSVTVRAIAS
ncbi:hypothetical protein [Amycolatopsis sp. YIM 10]|uniref:hypothetical protein n=1 Tax=Amycolatopsis sp. YIM 10 TaxID=2653857 RepID=UPI0012A84567|nr:hypothetical protein [Amycolatopsis sp. YIM 10]QFU90192.1 hypothetical protein YIM_25080 [Amycolatopsis sp. YIM 10]